MTALLEEQTVLVAGRGSGFARATVPVARTRGRGPQPAAAHRSAKGRRSAAQRIRVGSGSSRRPEITVGCASARELP
jgi:hypothetical protein